MNSKTSVVVLAFVLSLLCIDRPAIAGVILDSAGDAAGIDITSLEVSIGSSTVQVNLNFSPLTPILPPSANAPNSLSGFIEFDLDRDPSTGFNPGFVDFFGAFIGHPPTGLGVDGVILLGSEANHANVVELTFSSGLTGSGTLTTTATSLNIAFSRSLIGNSTELQFAAIVGDLNFVTDATGVGLANVSAVPEPSSFLMMGLACLLLMACQPMQLEWCRRLRTIMITD